MILLDPDLFQIKNFRVGALAMVLQQITLGGAMIALPLYLQVTLEYGAMRRRPVTGAALAHHVRRRAGRREVRQEPSCRQRHPRRVRTRLGRHGGDNPGDPRGESGWALLVPLLIAGVGLGLLVSQLNNYILGPIEEERVSEAARVNSAGQSFGLSFGLALAGGSCWPPCRSASST